jgi:5-methylcytosine-specific restriction endonuclease McrA
MRHKSVQKHLKPYVILKERTTTINHAFAAAIAPHDVYDEERVREAIKRLDQDPDNNLTCVYCGNTAETWDHVNATVRDRSSAGLDIR